MFAVKQAIRSLTRNLQPSLAPKLNLGYSQSPWTGILRKSPPITSLHACFSSSSNWATSIEKSEGPSNVLMAENITAHAEPDVLYHMIEVETRCSDRVVLNSYNRAIRLAAECLGLIIEINKFEERKRKPHIKRWTVLKSRHIHKKHMVTYEVRTYHHRIQFKRLTGSTADTFLEYIQRNLPEGVSMRVGRVRMEELPEHLLTPPHEVKKTQENKQAFEE